jgi:outer membrane protein OmpA-like peptidoglycan-associated protein
MHIRGCLVLTGAALIAACSHSAPSHTTAARTTAAVNAPRVQRPATAPPQQVATSTAQEPAPTTGTRVGAPTTHSFAPVAMHEETETACGDAEVRFARGSATLDAEARRQLDAYAQCVNGGPAHEVFVYGRIAPNGSTTTADNTALLGARARTVADYLHREGVGGDYEVRAQGGEPPTGAAPRGGNQPTIIRVRPVD